MDNNLNVAITAKVNNLDKLRFADICADLGVSVSTAINMLIRNCVKTNSILDLKASEDLPSKETISAILEMREELKHPENLKTYTSAEEMFADLEKED